MPEPGLGTKLACGAVAGVVGTSLIYPLDIIKTRLQNQRVGPSGPQYRSIIDCAQKIVAQNGVRGLYKGLLANLVGICPEKAIKLAVNDYARGFWGRYTNSHPDRLPVLYGMISGATAGFCQVIATNPMEMVKIQMQLSTEPSPATTSSSSTTASSQPRVTKPPVTTMEVVRQLGLRGLYRGTTATLARDVPFSLIFFPLVALFKSAFTPKSVSGEYMPTPFAAVFASGIVSGAFAAAAVTPMDVVKTRLQVIPKGGDKVYAGMAHCYREIIKHEGPGALFKGVVPRMLIVAPLFAITVLVYEVQQRYVSRLFATDVSTRERVG